MENMEKTKKAYEEILEVLNKHKNIIVFNVKDLEERLNQHLFGLELKEKYGLNIDAKDVRSLDWYTKGDFLSIGWWGGKYFRTIGWEDNNKHPKDELLLKISFTTGAYIFGDDYPIDFFNKFWSEVKSYNPKYCDSANKSLYFSMDNAGKIFNEFYNILQKYREQNAMNEKERKIKKMEEELEKMRANKT